MTKIYVFLSVLILLGCSDREQNKAPMYELFLVRNKEELIRTDIINQKFNLSKLLYDINVVDVDLRTNNIVGFKKIKFLNSDTILLLELDFNNYYVDDFYSENLFYIINLNSERWFVLQATQDDEFELYYQKNSFLIFDYYSSPVGLLKYYLFDIKNQLLYETQFLNENTYIDTNRFDINSLTLMTTDSIILEIYKLQSL